MRILVIDDNPLTLNAIGSMLESPEYDIVLESDPKRALARFRQTDFDVLITDMIMPDIDGVEIIRQVRRDHSGTWIVAISGGGDLLPATTTLMLSEAFGADRILYKPFGTTELSDAIQRK